MNDQFSQIDPSADRAGFSLSSRAKNMLYNTTSFFKGGPVLESTANFRPIDSAAAVHVSEQSVPRNGSTGLLKLSFALNIAGVVIGLVGLLRRERSESLVVLPAEQLDVVRTVPSLLEPPSALTPTDGRIGKEVVAEEQSIAVPVSHDEVFVERRPIEEFALTATTPIVGDEEMRIALSEDQLDVQKQIVVTDEVTISKADDLSTERISNTVHYDEPRL